MEPYTIIFTVLIGILDLGVCIFSGMQLSGLDRPGQRNNTFWKVGFSIGLALTFFIFTQILEQALSLKCGILFSGLLPLALVSLLAIVCFATDKSLIPRDVSMLLCVEHEWHKRLIRRMVILPIAYEMNTIIGNLLKNAIEEVRDKDPDLRYIRLILMHRSRHTVVRVSNPCASRV